MFGLFVTAHTCTAVYIRKKRHVGRKKEEKYTAHYQHTNFGPQCLLPKSCIAQLSVKPNSNLFPCQPVMSATLTFKCFSVSAVTSCGIIRNYSLVKITREKRDGSSCYQASSVEREVLQLIRAHTFTQPEQSRVTATAGKCLSVTLEALLLQGRTDTQCCK